MILAWLKAFQKPHESLSEILTLLDNWLAIFSNSTKYSILIYNENLQLPAHYSQYSILNRQGLREKSNDCKELENRILANRILTPKWKPAASALSFPYWFAQEDLVWNIDASDIQIGKNGQGYLEEAESYLLEHNLPMISQDLYLLPNNQFSFGVHLGRRLEMKGMIESVLPQPIRDLGWGINLDAMITQHCFRTNQLPFCFSTPEFICHEGEVGKGLCSRWNVERGMMETNYYGKRTQLGKLNPRCVVFA